MKHIEQIFKVKKPVVGMLHLDYLEGKEFKGVDHVVNKALTDIARLQNGGIDGMLIENWKEDSIGEFVSAETAKNFTKVVKMIAKHIKIPFGINVLNNDYKLSFKVAKMVKASFIELDVFVDKVKSNFIYSPISSKHPFIIDPKPKEMWNYAKSINAQGIPLFVFVQPKHYSMLENGKTIEKSTKQAIKEGATAVLVTKATGFAPTIDLIKRTKKAAGKYAVGIGSGFGVDNAKKILPFVDFAVVGTSIKVDGETDNPVDIKKVKELMKIAKASRI